MLNQFQKTLLTKTSFEGIGLHSGIASKITLVPSESDAGIIFKRIDLDKNNIIKANFKNVSSAKLCTTLQNQEGVSVSTVEHLLAALYITGIDNIIVEINCGEVPIMDGSSKDFIEIINQIGLKELDKKRKYLKIAKAIQFQDGDRTISLKPNMEGLEVDFQLSYEDNLIKNQSNKIKFYDDNLLDVYSSRTFCLFEDIEKIKKIGLAKGGSLDNAIVVKNNEVLNDGGLRNKKEFVNHKILDLAGDFMLAGYRVLATVKCNQGGHELSNLCLRKIFSDKSNFAEHTVDNLKVLNKNYKTPIKLAVNA